MQIMSIRSIFRTTYKNAHKQERLDAFRALYEGKFSRWQALKAKAWRYARACLSRFSHVTFYRHKNPLAKFNHKADSLVRIAETIDFECFRARLERGLAWRSSARRPSAV